VVDPRNAGLARRADAWLQVRPGSDGALALGLSHVMIQRGWYDTGFIRAWTNAPILVREDSSRLLRASDVGIPGTAKDYVACSETANGPVAATLGADRPDYALFGRFNVETTDGTVTCRPVFQLWAEICAEHDPSTVEEMTGVPASEVERTADMLWR